MKNHYLFLDESGHHGLKKINQQYPILLICGCVVEEKNYRKLTNDINKLKQKYFKTTDVILHSRDIRKWQKNFKILGDPKQRKEKNIVGTQLSDLVAYPLATKILYPDRENLAFRVIESKIYRQFPDGDYLGYGLKIFP